MPHSEVNLETDSRTWDETEFVWDVPSWSDLISKRSESSSEFECANARWKLVLFPDGYVYDNVSFHLESVNASETQVLGWSRIASFEIAFVNTTNHDIQKEYCVLKHHQFDCSKPIKRTDGIISKSELMESKILQGDLVSLFVKLRVSKPELAPSSNHHQTIATKASAWAQEAATMGFDISVVPIENKKTDGTKRLKPFVNCPIKADVELIFEIDVCHSIIEKSFFGHKEILASSSKYFEAMFDRDSGFQESSEFTIKIQLPIILTFTETMFVLEFAYTGCKEGPLEHTTINWHPSSTGCLLRLALIAEYLQMEPLLTCICEKLDQVGGRYFTFKVGSMEGTVISHGILSTLLTMCRQTRRDHPIKSMLEWLELTLSCEDRPIGWDQTPEGLQQLKNLIDAFIVPRAKVMALAELPKEFQGISEKLMSHVPLHAIMMAHIVSSQ